MTETDIIMKRKPNLFLVGAAKSGTTAMDTYLARHPDVFMAVKEPHYFATDLLDASRPGRQWERYCRIFAPAEDQKVVGESSVFYLYSREAARNIRAFAPDARILIHLRNPLEVIPSHHSQNIFEGNEPLEDLREALAAEEDRLQGKRLPDHVWQLVTCYRDFVKFHDQVKRFMDEFPREQIKINFFDDLKKDTRAVYQDTCRFLEIDPDFEAGFEVMNPNKKMRSKKAMDMFVRNPPPWLSAIAKAIMPLESRTALKAKIKEVNTAKPKRDPLPQDLREALKRDLAEDVEKLSRLVDRDLMHWVS